MASKLRPVARGDRVRVTNQHNNYRNQLGSVISIGSDKLVWVRIDGHERLGSVPFARKDLASTTFQCNVEYDSYRELQALLPQDGA